MNAYSIYGGWQAGSHRGGIWCRPALWSGVDRHRPNVC